ncbi:MAG TPA: hypothetical protein VFV50_08180 [Bdellovibrionales bacterium]|nr:hypothetical protein [Bdellovibrionales bacterium]
MRALFAFLTLTLITSQSTAAEQRNLIDERMFSRAKAECKMLEDKDRVALNNAYDDLVEKSERENLAPACESSLKTVEELRLRIVSTTQKMAGFDYHAFNECAAQEREDCDYQGALALENEMDAHVGQLDQELQTMLRACPGGSKKLDKLMFALDAGLGVAGLFAPGAGLITAIKIGKGGTEQALKFKKSGFGWRNWAGLGWFIARRTVPGAGIANQIWRGIKFGFSKFKGDDKHQYVDKLLACRTGKLVQQEAEEECRNPYEDDDKLALRDFFSRLAGNKSNKNAPGFCEETACLWSFGTRRTDNKWKQNVSALFTSLPQAPVDLDEDGKPDNPNERLNQGLDKVNEWRNHCNQNQQIQCRVSCRMDPGASRALPVQRRGGDSGGPGDGSL